MKRTAILAWPLAGICIQLFEALVRFLLDAPFSAQRLIWSSVGWMEWALLAPLVVVLSTRFPYRPGRRTLFFVVHGAALVPVSLTHSTIFFSLRTLFTGHPAEPGQPLLEHWVAAFPLHFTLDTMVYSGTLIATQVTLFLRASWKREQERLALERRIAGAELDTYKLRLPSAAVSQWLLEIEQAIDRNVHEAERRIAGFSVYLRQSLAAVSVHANADGVAHDDDMPAVKRAEPLSFPMIVALLLLVVPVAALILNVILALSAYFRDRPVTWARFFYNMNFACLAFPVTLSMAWLGSRVRRLEVLGAAAMALPVLWIALVHAAYRGWDAAREILLQTSRAVDVVLFFGVALGGLAYTRYKALRANAIAVAELDARLLRTRARLLRTQLNPHLLFNALNSIAALLEDDTAGAKRMAAQLREFVVRVLEMPDRHDVTLAEELELLQTYVGIENVRFENRLELDVHVDDDARRARIPSFLLQPLVENAVRHGLTPDTGGRISVLARVEGSTLSIEVRDDGHAPDAPLREGVGLSNTRARLRQKYRDAFTMEIVHGKQGFSVRLGVPYET